MKYVYLRYTTARTHTNRKMDLTLIKSRIFIPRFIDSRGLTVTLNRFGRRDYRVRKRHNTA